VRDDDKLMGLFNILVCAIALALALLTFGVLFKRHDHPAPAPSTQAPP
jgi:hypothetical protein